nr:uncharacterized mitochondrial protein AtMg00810-like [Tanacetum cinerariifolium]
ITIPPPYIGKFMPPKLDLVFNNTPSDVETAHSAFNVKLSPTKPANDLSHIHRPSAPIIEDWVSNSEDESKTKSPQNVSISTIVPKIKVTRPRQATTIFTKSKSPPRRHINHSPSSKASTFLPKVTTVKAPMVNVAHVVQGKWKWKPKCPVLDHVSRNTSASMTLKRVIHNRGEQMDRSTGPDRTKRISVWSSGTCPIYLILTSSMVDILPLVETQRVFNLFSVSQMCDKKNSVLFNDTECLVLSPDFKLPDENQILLRVPRENNMYNVDLKNIVPSRDLTCLFAKETLDESKLWHRKLGHINFKTMNKLVKCNLVRGLPSKVFENDHTCVACKKGKQHRASYSLGKFDGKVDEGFLVGYSVSSKAFRVFNSKTRIIQETMHIKFMENKPNVTGSGPTWLFDIDTLTKTMNYQPVTAGNQSNTSAGNTDGDAAFDVQEPEFEGRKPESKVNVYPSSKFEDFFDNSIKEDNAAGTLVPTVRQISTNSTNTFSAAGPSNVDASLTHGKSSCIDTSQYSNDLNMLELEYITYSDNEDNVGAEAEFSNLETSITVSPIPTTRVHKDHYVTQIIGHTQEEGINYKEVFAAVARIEAIRLLLAYASLMGYMLYQMDVKRDFLYGTIKEEVYVYQPLGFKDPDYPDKKKDGIFNSHDKYVAKILRKFGLTDGKSASTPIDTEKPLLKNPDGEDVDVHTYISMIGSLMYLTSSRPDIMFTQCKKQTVVATSSTEAEYVTAASCCAQVLWIQNQLLIMGVNTLRCDGDSLELIELTVFLLPSDEKVRVKVSVVDLQVSAVSLILQLLVQKFLLLGLTNLFCSLNVVRSSNGKSASTPIYTKKPLLKDPDGKDVDVHTYRSMIGSLMYLTSSRPDIMFAVFACSHFQVTPKALHLHAVKRIFRYLKGKPHLGLWYPKDLPFNLVAYSDGDYAGASLDCKSTVEGCQFLGCRLISWQYKKQIVVATSSTEAKYVATAS